MSDLNFNKIEQSIKDRKELQRSFRDHIKTNQPLNELQKLAFQSGAIDKKMKELMALSISIVTKCEPCMESHLYKAMKAGASDEEIYETIDVAIEMGGGPAGAYARFVLKALEYFKKENK